MKPMTTSPRSSPSNATSGSCSWVSPTALPGGVQAGSANASAAVAVTPMMRRNRCVMAPSSGYSARRNRATVST